MNGLFPHLIQAQSITLEEDHALLDYELCFSLNKKKKMKSYEEGIKSNWKKLGFFFVLLLFFFTDAEEIFVSGIIGIDCLYYACKSIGKNIGANLGD